MEPDSTKNLERSGSSKRRISSILKAPRKSAKYTDLEQQENVVECAKPVEKRNSRRVSFAPADDVLLFSKDVKNTSSNRNPFQELLTGPEGLMQNREVAVTEDDSQQIIGIKNLLIAPLHDQPQREKDDFNTPGAFGEKTVMFSQHDALMDMTHSTSINIVTDLPGDDTFQSFEAPTGGNKRVIFPEDPLSVNKNPSCPLSSTGGSMSLFNDRNLDPCIEKTKGSASMPCLDLNFENVLANILKPSGSSTTVTKVSPPAGYPSEDNNCLLPPIKTQQVNFDDKNEAPTSALMGKSLNTSRKSGGLSTTLWQQDSVAMDMTEVQTGLFIAAGDDDPLQGLFPSQDIYAGLENESSKAVQAVKTPQQQSSDNLALNTTEGRKSLIKAPQSPQQSKITAVVQAECSDGTVMFTADEMFMDMTQSHTVNIGDHLLGADVTSTKYSNPQLKSQSSAREPSVNTHITRMTSTFGPSVKDAFNTTGSLSYNTPEAHDGKENQPMNSRRSFGALRRSTVQPGHDISVNLRQSHLGSNITDTNELPSCFPTQSGSVNEDGSSCQSTETRGAIICKGLETQSKSASNTNQKTQQVESDAYGDCNEKTIRFAADGAFMDLTQCQTVNIDHDLELPSLKHNEHLPTNEDKTVRFSADDAVMDENRSYNAKLLKNFNTKALDLETLHTYSEKTVRFSADDADMNITRSHTVNLLSDLNKNNQIPEALSTCKEKSITVTAENLAPDEKRHPSVTFTAEPPIMQLNQRNDFLPLMGANTLRLPSNCAAMDVTGSKNEDIDSNLKTRSHVFEPLSMPGEHTVMFLEDDAAMEMTGSCTANISKLPPHQFLDCQPTNREKTFSLDVSKSNITTNLQSNSQYVDLPPTHGEKERMVTADDTVMDVTRSHTGNIATDFPNMNSFSRPATQLKSASFVTDAELDSTRDNALKIVNNFESKSQSIALPMCEVKQTKPTPNEDCMEMTQCLTLNIERNYATDSSPPPHLAVSIHEDVAFPSVVKEAEDQTCGLPKELLSSPQHSDGERSEGEDPHALLPQETINTSGFLLPKKTRKPDVNIETEDTKQASAVMEKVVDQTIADISVSMDLTEAQKSCILGQTNADKTSPMQKSSLKRRSDAPLDPEVMITELPEADKTEATTETEKGGLTCSLTEEMGNFVPDQDSDIVRSRKSRRKSLADLQSKLRRLSHTINAEPEPTDLGSCTVPQCIPVNNSSDKTTHLMVEPEPQIEVDQQDQCLTTSQPTPAFVPTTPFTARTKQLMSRLSVGHFQPKLPQRSKTEEAKKVNPRGDQIKAVRAISHLSNFDHDVSDINDEELGSLEDVSETLITESPPKIIEQHRSYEESELKDLPLEDDVLEAVGTDQNQKRHLYNDDDTPNEKRLKPSTENVQMSDEAENNIDGTTRISTQTTDSNSSHTASMRAEATFESTFKQSLFESQLDDYTSDLQMKLEDGTITVSEFFKLFNIDFVIHTPRQSVCPGRLLLDSEMTPLDLLKERHVSHPKQMVYEADIRALTEKVERLKVRMGDLDKPLRTVNAALWEEMKYSSEKELKSFGVKLKEQNNFFRKNSKVQSHEMKEVLFSSLKQANLEEQQKLKGTIEKADEMIKSLDDCISNLEAEIAAVEGTGSENKQSIRFLQEEMKRITETFDDNTRQVSDLETQKHQNLSKLTRLKAETGNLESHLDMLDQLSEWKVKERTDDLTVFTFLHETMILQLTYEKSIENAADAGFERKIDQISFEFLLDEDGSQDHARLVHNLVSQFIKEESAWEEKYPTTQHVPKLLHDVSLVVSRCRLLGEECRRLRMWGSLPFDILNISCHDSKVSIVFSCLEKFAKFEVVFAVSLVNRLYVVQLESFKNKIGSIAMDQIEEIVASFTPGKNLLTKIVKKIHETLLT